MNVVFVNYHNFTSNSAVHIFNLANHLVEIGNDCAVCVPDEKQTVRSIGKPRFLNVNFREVRNSGVRFKDGNGATIIHAWTPRELVRELTEELATRYGCSYIIHLEDNEESIVAANLGMGIDHVKSLPPQELDRLVGKGLSHPTRYKEFIGRAIGVTALIDRLFEFKPQSIPGKVFWPGYEEQFCGPLSVDNAKRRELGIGEDEYVVVYPGNAHAANCKEVSSLYLAVGLLNRRGIPVKLIRTGTDYVQLFDDELEMLRQHCIELGYRPRPEIPGLMALADILVQPGGPGDFNDYRFPSKIPEFLATGKPVILPNTNIGRYLKNGKECLLLEKGNALEIADKMHMLWKDASLRERIGHGGRKFAETNFSWAKSATRLHKFYERVLAQPIATRLRKDKEERDSQSRATGFRCNAANAEQNIVAEKASIPTAITESRVLWKKNTLETIYRRYSTFKAPTLSYATVRDYCDSMDHLPTLTTMNRDMKEVQRPWVFKAILGTVKRRARLLEIGAGEPVIADLLSRLGYEVLIVDPYDGSGNGPRAFEAFTAAYPHIRFIRDYFTDDLQGIDPGSFDGIYSISVLEHIPTSEIGKVFAAIRRFLKAGGYSIHAIDHVHKGTGDKYHLEKLRMMIEEMGIPIVELEELLRCLSADPETYFLSASGHNLWRGDIAYDKFPMRRCASIHTCTQVDSASL